jgi:hypothetical protein
MRSEVKPIVTWHANICCHNALARTNTAPCNCFCFTACKSGDTTWLWDLPSGTACSLPNTGSGARSGRQRTRVWGVNSTKASFCSTLTLICYRYSFTDGARGIVGVEALSYKKEGRGFENQGGEWVFFNLPNPSCRTTPWGRPDLPLQHTLAKGGNE